MRRFAVAALFALVAATGLRWAPTTAQQAGQIRILAPANGATVTAPVQLTVEITGVPVKPAAVGDPDAYHYHALVDVDPATVVQPGQPLPTGQANIIHTADLTITLPDLAPGPHTVTVVLTKTDHVPLSPSVQQRVQFVVVAPGQSPTTPPIQPRVGTGGLPGDTRMPAWLAPFGLLALGGGLLLIRRARRM